MEQNHKTVGYGALTNSAKFNPYLRLALASELPAQFDEQKRASDSLYVQSSHAPNRCAFRSHPLGLPLACRPWQSTNPNRYTCKCGIDGTLNLLALARPIVST